MKGSAIFEKVSFPVSVETIYTIYSEMPYKEKICTYLPYNKKTKKRRIKRNMSTFQQQKIQIDGCSPEINTCSIIGHWERSWL